MSLIVLMCTHNGNKYLKEQLSSIIDQVTPVDKILIHDYASSDNTVDTIAEYKNKNIHVRQHLNVPGPKESFLQAIAMEKDHIAHDDLVFLCDQDDYWYQYKTNQITKLFELGNIDVAWHDVDMMDADSNVFSKSWYKGVLGNFPVTVDNLPVYWNKIIGNTICVRGWILKEFLNDDSAEVKLLKNFSRMHDEALMLYAKYKGYKGGGIPISLSKYRIHPDNAVGTPKLKLKNLGGKIKKDFEFLKLFQSVQFANPEGEKPVSFLSLIYLRYFKIMMKIRGIFTNE